MKWFLLLGVLVSGCGLECTDGESRCNGEVVMVCEGRTWERKEDCAPQGLRCWVGGRCGSGACCQL
ncbi:MAG: hypothetical protein ACOZQL_30520 [Myxococcota bacterium]